MKTKQLIAASLLLALTFNLSFAQGLYSNGERITSVLQEKWGATSAWENNTRYAVTYQTPTDAQFTQEKWNGFSWDLTEKNAVTLNANYSFNNIITQRWDGTQAAWRNKGRTNYTYYNNDPTKTLVYKYDTANVVNNTVWDDYQRTTHTYNTNGLELQQIQEKKNGSIWKAESRNIYTYNANSLKTSYAWQQWETAGYWKSLIKDIYYYNANSLISLKIDSSYAYLTPQTNVANNKTQYVYNANNLVAQESQTNYNTTNNAWETYVYSKRTYTYNPQNLQTRAVYDTYDTNTSAYRTSSINTFAYNAQNLRTQENFETYDYNLGVLLPYSNSTNTYNNANNVLVYTYNSQRYPSDGNRTTYTYGTVVGTEQAADLSFAVRLFPNPTAEQINITLPDNTGVTVAMLMAANGLMIKMQNLTDTQTTINVNDLAAGSYQILLLNGGKSAVKTFVKQ